jgi:hypothetical protein
MTQNYEKAIIIAIALANNLENESDLRFESLLLASKCAVELGEIELSEALKQRANSLKPVGF